MYENIAVSDYNYCETNNFSKLQYDECTQVQKNW